MKKIVKIKDYELGNGKIYIQSMTNTKTSDLQNTINQINDLITEGVEIIRVAVKDINDALAIKELKKVINIPIIADIHFDYNLAIKSIENGADKIRINPGNMPIKHIASIIEVANKYQIPIRIGVNSGSLSSDILDKFGNTTKALIEEMKREVEIFENLGFTNLVLSIKSTDIFEFIEANIELDKLYDYPLHIGLTESGTSFSGSIRSSFALGTLINKNIGDTLRVSLTGNPINEVIAAKEILKIFNKYDEATLISCPTCGRCEYNMEEIIKKIEPIIKKIKLPIKVAIMGCIVNGIGEGKTADIGIAGGKNQAVIFRNGNIIRKVKENEIIDAFKEELNILLKEKKTK